MVAMLFHSSSYASCHYINFHAALCIGHFKFALQFITCINNMIDSGSDDLDYSDHLGHVDLQVKPTIWMTDL